MNIYDLHRSDSPQWKVISGVDIAKDATERPYVRLNRYNTGGNLDDRFTKLYLHYSDPHIEVLTGIEHGRLTIAHPIFIHHTRSIELGRVSGRVDDGRCLVVIRSRAVKIRGSAGLIENDYPDLDQTLFVGCSVPVLLGSAEERQPLYINLIDDYDTLWLVSPGNTLIVDNHEFMLRDNGFTSASCHIPPECELWL